MDVAPALYQTADWLAEWKYDGIRALLLRRGRQAWIWSRVEEPFTERFPEIAARASVASRA